MFMQRHQQAEKELYAGNDYNEKVEVTVDVKIDNITNSNDIFEYKPDSNNEIAYLSFCVAANLGSITVYNNETGLAEESSISYLHMLFNITISLSQGFNATSVDIEEVGPNNVDESPDVDYNVNVFQVLRFA